jgi:hypothetical protein
MFQPLSPTSLTVFIEIRMEPESTPAPGKHVGRTMKLCHLDLCGMLAGETGRWTWRKVMARCEVIGVKSHGTMSELWPSGRIQNKE